MTVSKYIIIFCFMLFILFMLAPTAFADICYPDGCLTFTEWGGDVDGAAGWFSTLDTYLAWIARYYSYEGLSVEYDSLGRILVLTCGNGAQTFVTSRGCANGATNSPTCDVCAAGTAMVAGQCRCGNGATNPSSCNQCPAGQGMYNGICTCSNGALDTPSCTKCPTDATLQGGQCVCTNAAVPQSNCTQCQSGYVMAQGKCMLGCDLTNVCGQKAQGVFANGTCQMPDGSDANNSCITSFTTNVNSVYPGGEASFSWKIAAASASLGGPQSVGSRCGFVDLTTPTPRPIPGLQNLDPKRDTAKISNIQTTTRFCLVCQYYKLTTNAVLGTAAAHQWIRVTKVGEQ